MKAVDERDCQLEEANSQISAEKQLRVRYKSALERRTHELEVMSADTVRVKEQLSVTITEVNDLKHSNSRLRHKLAAAADKNSELQSHIKSMEVAERLKETAATKKKVTSCRRPDE